MAIGINSAKIGMLVQALSFDVNSKQVSAYKKAADKVIFHRYSNGTNIGQIIAIDPTTNRVRVQVRKPLISRLRIKTTSVFIDPADLLVVPLKVTLPTNVAELKEMYVLSGKTNVLVRRSPITGAAFAKVNGNQMVRVTGQAKSGYTEIVTSNGNGWVATRFLTATKPTTVVTPPTPSVIQEPQGGTSGGTTPDPVTPGVVYVPTEKPADNSKTAVTVLLAFLGGLALFKLFKKKTSKPV